MTIQEYLNDDSAKVEREAFDKEYPQIANKIVHRIYRHRDLVIYHVVVPSSKPGEVSYDVVIEVKTLALHPGDANIERLPMRIFSNCPSFAFGHAYRLSKSKVLIDWLENKLSPIALREPPTRPPKSYLEKSTYMALRYIHDNGLSSIGVYKTTGRQIYTTDDIYFIVRRQEEILQQVQERIDKRRAEREEEEERKRRAKEEEEERRASNRTPQHVTKTTPKTKQTGTTKLTKTSRFTKFIGRIKRF